MCKLEEFFKILDSRAPIEYSYKCIERGDYDNSGIILKCKDAVSRALFSLDLSVFAVESAKKKKCDLIVTHHPAIYDPISKLSVEEAFTAALTNAAVAGISVISMHLNLDTAKEGLDHYLAKGLGAKSYKILDVLEDGGYGREFETEGTLSEFVKGVKKEFDTERVLFYGNKNDEVKMVASFCGGGSSHAIRFLREGKISADTIVTSDVPHHAIKEIVESGKKLVIVSHYPAEEYGFNRFYEDVKNELNDKAETLYFCDKRFK